MESDLSAARTYHGILFQFPSNGKVHGKGRLTGLDKQGLSVSIPFKREGTWKETLFSTQTGRGFKYPKTKHELRQAFFL